jgi:hypothetical protein
LVSTHLDGQLCDGARRRELDVVRQQPDGSGFGVVVEEQLLQVSFQRFHHQLVHHPFQDGVQIEKLRRFQLAPLPLDLLVEPLLAVFHQVVLHPRHELPHVPHYYLRIGLFRLAGASDEVVDVLSERGVLVLGQLQGVGPDGGPHGFRSAPLSVPQRLQTWGG